MGVSIMNNRFLARLFPPAFDNIFPGQKIALWVFYALTAVTLWRSQHHVFAADGGAQSIATIPLDTYTQGGAAAVVTIFALWGLAQLGMGLLYLLAIIRYKSMIPLLYLLFVLEYGGRLFVGSIKPIETVSTAPGAAVNLPFFVAGMVLLVLSLVPPKNSET